MEGIEGKIGEVVAVAGSTVSVVSCGEIVETKLRLSDYVLIEGIRSSCIGQITALDSQDIFDQQESKHKAKVVMSIMLVCTVSYAQSRSVEGKTISVSVGIREHPMLGASCYALRGSFVRYVLSSMVSNSNNRVNLDIGNLADVDNVPFTISAEALFGRHCAIVGTSGGGKSWSIARIVEESAKHNCKVIIVDATGEFSALERPVTHVHIGKPDRPKQKSLEVGVPYFQLLESDLFAIFQPSANIQAPKMRAAIKTLKLLELAPHLSLNGTLIKVNKHKLQYLETYSRYYRELEGDRANFNILKLADQLKFECINEIRSATETDYWGAYNQAEEASVFPLISRVNDILGSKTLDAIFSPGDLHSLFDIIEWFITHEESRILCLSLEHLPFLHRARQLVTNSLGRQLMSYARSGRFIDNPILLVVDEAHHFLDSFSESKSLDYPLDSFASIAKEGRKYSLSMCISTQRPRDIPESIMSQMGTMLVHRLTNDGDRSIIERSTGQIDSKILDSLPSLSPGEAILLGIDIPVPLKLSIGMPRVPPMSRGPDYQQYWGRK